MCVTITSAAYDAGIGVVNDLSSALGVEGEATGEAQLSQEPISLASRLDVQREPWEHTGQDVTNWFRGEGREMQTRVRSLDSRKAGETLVYEGLCAVVLPTFRVREL